MLKFLKRFGKVLLLALGAVTSSIVVWKLRKAIVGKIGRQERANFKSVSGDPKKINVIRDDGSTEVIELPDGVKYKDVVAVGVTEGNKIIVEKLHESTNRRNPGWDRDDNALDAVRSRVHPDDENGSNGVDDNPVF